MIRRHVQGRQAALLLLIVGPACATRSTGSIELPPGTPALSELRIVIRNVGPWNNELDLAPARGERLSVGSFRTSNPDPFVVFAPTGVSYRLVYRYTNGPMRVGMQVSEQRSGSFVVRGPAVVHWDMRTKRLTITPLSGPSDSDTRLVPRRTQRLDDLFRLEQ